MTNGSKIQLTPQELSLVGDRSFFEAKQRISLKIYELLGALKTACEKLPEHQHFHFPEDTDYQPGKISRGENLKGLPYIVLDFPRRFEGNDVFAFRTIFWWGNYVGFHFVLANKMLETYGWEWLKRLSSSWLFCLHDTPWEHDIDDRSVAVSGLDSVELKSHFSKKGFLKISQKMELSEMANLPQHGAKLYQDILKTLQS